MASVSEVDQLRVDRVDVARVLVAQLHGDARILLKHGKYFQAAPAADAPRLLTVIGDALQLVDHEPRHDERSVTGSLRRPRR